MNEVGFRADGSGMEVEGVVIGGGRRWMEVEGVVIGGGKSWMEVEGVMIGGEGTRPVFFGTSLRQFPYVLV